MTNTTILHKILTASSVKQATAIGQMLCLITSLISPAAYSENSQITNSGPSPNNPVPLTTEKYKDTRTNKFIKKGIDGKTLTNNSATWSCVEDINNGLIWEVKSKDSGMHDKNNSYTWLQPSSTEISQGVADGGKCKGDTDCDTLSYVQAINEQNYCGYSDWRLPTREEMLSIVSYKSADSMATINNDYFPETLPSWYWTASSNEEHAEHAWYVLFRNGIALNDLKGRAKHIRLVRSNISAQQAKL
ncbi:MAG: DUF1566 domain-containing protein [Gammaproteobacteria bacterium]|nr:DUF1566 domain-containing protein [Gammaproteobacteria bacterium]